MVRREETAYSFLATLLDYDLAFRTAFLRLVLDDPAEGETESWLVAVEQDHVDVTLESPRTIVLIEDKINAGAKQQEQLLRYYRGAVEAKPNKRIVAVYLAPGGMGAAEVEAVRRNADFAQREADLAARRVVPMARPARLRQREEASRGSVISCAESVCSPARRIAGARDGRRSDDAAAPEG